MYKIAASCCQVGFWCGAIPFNCCQSVSFDLTNANGGKIQTIQKKGAGALANFLTDANNFYIDFSNNMDWKQRALLCSSLLMIDMMLFSRQKSIA